ncbi:MAG: hypothetical protein ACI4HJ_03095 [Ruminococcus sp.]
MDNSYDLLKIYGIPRAGYNEDNPDDLYLNNLPSLEQIASFNLALQTGGQQSGALPPISSIQPGGTNTPSTTIGQGATDVNTLQYGNYGSSSSPSSAMENTSISGMTTITPPNANQTSEPTELAQQITDFSKPYPITAESIQFLNGFIRTQIGRRAQIQFLVGSSDIVEKDGFILGVGSNYILINEIGTNDITACDFYNIKFIRFLY